MHGRDRRNLRIALLAEWGVAVLMGAEPGVLPSSAIRARENNWRDGGFDLVTDRGVRIDVKASGPRYRELMVPVAHERKFRRADCPVDAFVKAVVDGAEVELVCWERRVPFLERAHRDPGSRFPIPTLFLEPEEANPVGARITVPERTLRALETFLDEVPDQPWERWLTL